MSDFSYQMGTNSGREFEVGWSYEGTPTSELKVRALQEMLDTYGDSLDTWTSLPEIRLREAGASVQDWGRGPITVFGDVWAVYGVLANEPEGTWVREGERIPLRNV